MLTGTHMGEWEKTMMYLRGPDSYPVDTMGFDFFSNGVGV
jgi:hypothetical protein